MIELRPARLEDAAAIAAIYAPFVIETPISFETDPPDAGEMLKRMQVGNGLYPWFVAQDGDARILGFSYASPFRAREAYRFAVETSVYVDQAAQGQRIGMRLYELLLRTLEKQGFTQAIGAVALPNAASVSLHERLGFQPAGAYRKVGFKFDRWHDVALWQRSLAPSRDRPEEPRPVKDLPTD